MFLAARSRTAAGRFRLPACCLAALLLLLLLLSASLRLLLMALLLLLFLLLLVVLLVLAAFRAFDRLCGGDRIVPFCLQLLFG